MLPNSQVFWDVNAEEYFPWTAYPC